MLLFPIYTKKGMYSFNYQGPFAGGPPAMQTIIPIISLSNDSWIAREPKPDANVTTKHH